jgi:hypothetical protein
MAAPVPLHRYSFSDYLALEGASNTKHEFLDGEIWVPRRLSIHASWWRS